MIVDTDKIMNTLGLTCDKDIVASVAQWCYDNRKNIPVKSPDGTFHERVLHAIDATLADMLSLSLEDMRARTRARTIYDARLLAMRAYWQITQSTMTEVARIFGKDHATVSHCFKDFEFRSHQERALRENYEYFKKSVEEKL